MPQIGRYQVVRELGRGAMGIVFEARDPLIDRTVAVKTIRLDTLGEASEAEALQERLFREARSAGALSHPGIVVVHDLGRHEDVAYIAMERVDGPTLEHVLATGGIPKREEALRILRQTAAALDYAHQRGVVHRDIKPGNLMLDSGQVKITDFGIAKIASTQQLTRTGTVMGTPSYMSPEQITAQPLDGRADQFSLAVIAFEMLAGARPFRADTLAGLVHQIVYEDRASARSLRAELPAAVDEVLRRGLAKNAGERYPSCVAFVEDLERGLAGAGVAPVARKGVAWRWIAAAVATVVVVAGLVTAGVVWHRRSLVAAVPAVPGDEAAAAYSAKDYARVRLLAEEGNAEAQDDVGFMYESGRGVAKDRAQAVEWYRKSAAQGYQPARDALKRFGLVP
jgi:eukaryotic-like serine/threonine-protein kinase